MKRLLAILLALWAATAQAQMMTGVGPERAGTAVAAGQLITPILSMDGPNAGNPNNAAARYGAIAGGASGQWASTATGVTQTIPIAGSFSKLHVVFPTFTGTSYTVALYNTSAATALTCNVTPSSTCDYTASSVTVAAGDQLAWVATPNTVTTAPTTPVQISALFTSTASQETFLMLNHGATALSNVNGTTNWIGFVGPNQPNATEVIASALMPAGGNIDRLFCNIAGTPSPGTYTCQLYVNGSAVGATCAMNSASPCSDVLTAAVHVNAGNTVSVGFTPSASVGTARAGWGGVRFVPDVANQSIILSMGVPQTTATRFASVNGFYASPSTTETSQNITPAVTSMTLANLIVAQSTVPTTSRAVTLRANSTSKSPSVTLTPSDTMTIGGVAGTFAKQDPSNSYASSTNDLLDYQITVGATQGALTWHKIAMTAVVVP